MKIGLQTWGTDGDIRPFIALAGGLRSAGHDVTLVVTSMERKRYDAFAEPLDIAIFHAGELLYTKEELRQFYRRMLTAWHFLAQMNILMTEMFNPVLPEMYEAAEQLCRDNDLVIGHFIHYPLQAAAEKAGKPHATVWMCHGVIRSRHTRVIGSPPLGTWTYPLAWKIASVLSDLIVGRNVNRLRKEVGLPPARDIMNTILLSNRLNLIAESAVIGVRQPDWPDQHQVCGFLSVPDQAEDWSMPGDLKHFIEAGPPPVFMTVGSMLSFDESPREITSLLVEAAVLAGCRAIIQSRWDEIAGIPEHPQIYRIRKVPHQHVFPLCAAVVHHGGAGTTHSALRHGCPSIVIAYCLDQPFFATELKRLGVGGDVLLRKDVSAQKLAKALRRVIDSLDIKKKAEALGAIMRKEDGVKKAIGLIEARFSAPATSRDTK